MILQEWMKLGDKPTIKETPNVVRMQGNKNSYLLLVGLKNEWYRISGRLAFSYKSKQFYSAITVLSIYPNMLKNLCPHKNLYMDVYNNFIHNCQNMEATKMSLSRCIDKHTVVHPGNGLLSNT